MAILHVVLVGHCGFDSGNLISFVEGINGDVEVTRVNDECELGRFRNGESLWLINRVLEGPFEAGDGLEMVENEAGKEGGPRVMLITNYEDWLANSVKAGGVAGFGKSAVGGADAAACLKAAMA